jgi:hypothetical protein
MVDAYQPLTDLTRSGKLWSRCCPSTANVATAYNKCLTSCIISVTLDANCATCPPVFHPGRRVLLLPALAAYGPVAGAERGGQPS